MANEQEDPYVRLTLRRASANSGQRDGGNQPEVALRRVSWLESPLSFDDPVPVTALGVAYKVVNRVNSVQENSPAHRAGIQKNDVITKAEFIYRKGLKESPEIDPVDFANVEQDTPGNNWAGFLAVLQNQPADTRVKLTYKRNDKETTVELTPELDHDSYNARRGLIFDRLRRIRVAESFNEQVERGFEETTSSLGLVYRFLSKLGTQVKLTNLGGPITIAQAAGYSAFDGLGRLLVFLTMLSANLAVINFLPIPLLDGGHMVFLAYEGLRGRPAGERLVVAMHTIGFVFIISLMLFVISMDVRRLLGFA